MKKILIVDDEKSFLLSLKDGLKKHQGKFQVLLAENGSEAVNLLRTTAIDLLVTDLKMPEMNGFELLAWVSRHQPQLPVIVMSAFGTPEIEARLEKMDTLQFLEKPLDLAMLEEGILNGLNVGGKSFIRGITLATFLQLMKAENKNCTLKVTAGERQAFLFVNRGEVIDAEYNDLSGLDAALEVVCWNDAEIEMDGICRRHEDIIDMKMEHLLIEAFKRRDEESEILQADSIREMTVEDPVRKRLADILSRLPAILDYIVFDDNNQPESQSSGAKALSTIDPREYEKLLVALGDGLALGEFNSLVLNTTNRHRYLLFNSRRRRVLARLKPGAQAQQVIKEVKRHVNR